MSYEGYTEYLCAAGHYSSQNVYDGDLKECPHCGARLAFSHEVDETNGYDESHPYTCDAPKEEIGFDDVWHVDHYGNRYTTKLARYRPLAEWGRSLIAA